MTSATQERLPTAAPLPPTAPASTWTPLAGVCSLGAGAVHAAAVGAHGEHRAAAVVFTLLAAAQLLWGGTALVRRGPLVALSGVLVGLAAVGGWLLAKTIGVPYVDGLDTVEPLQAADTTAAALAFAAVLLAALGLRASGPRLPVGAAAVAVAVAASLATTAIGAHVHPAGETSAHAHAGSDAPHVEARPYDPALPIDLSGTPGVTPAQQAEAENLVAVSLLRLPRWADPEVAEAAGFTSIGDGFTGHEHLINDAWLDDDHVLDPDHPEALVYDTSGGGRRLVAAMYMLDRGTPLDQVPPFGGGLVQWHTHEDLCFGPDGRVRGLIDAARGCPTGLAKPVPTPMVHVWIEAHRCGPFAALDGVAGGRIPDGEARFCDHAHGTAS